MFQPLETFANGLLLPSKVPSGEHEDSHYGDNTQKVKKVRGIKDKLDKRQETAFGPEYMKVFRIRSIPLTRFQKSMQIDCTSCHHDLGCSGTEMWWCSCFFNIKYCFNNYFSISHRRKASERKHVVSSTSGHADAIIRVCLI